MEINNYIKLEFPSLSENIGLTRVTVAAFAAKLEFTVPELDEIKLAISEAVTNCIVHAYPENIGKIIIEVKLNNGILEVLVKDEGCGIDDVAAAMEPEYTTLAGRMGLGFAFMGTCMDGLKVESEPGLGTSVYMFKKPEDSGK